jgi:hypothetical protein
MLCFTGEFFLFVALSLINQLNDPALVPSCPTCGGPVMMNVNGGSWFITGHRKEQKLAYQHFLDQYR